MSLINDALKKAQRLRNEGASSDTPPVPGAIAKRAQPRTANTIVLIVGGALLLVVLSVALTVYLVNRPAAPAASAVAPVTTPPAATPVPVASAPAPAAPPMGPPADFSPAAPAPAISPQTEKVPPPAIPETKSIASAAPAPTPAAERPALPPATSTAPVTAAPEPAPPAPARPDERVTAFVESVRVTGIRSSGTESRVLMNERVYRVNDVVDRALGVRLIKVAGDSLTFSDANGVNYIKYF